MYFRHDTDNRLLEIHTEDFEPVSQVKVTDAAAQCIELPILKTESGAEGLILRTDASQLELWNPDHPVLYTLYAGKQSCRFGFSALKTEGSSAILLNGVPIYLRGYIRGIVAHDHPNMTGRSRKEAARKNIRQAKKYGFNSVRFHSTVPSPEFVEAADEEGLLIHMEIGFSYEYNAQGEKQNLSLNNTRWRETIRQYRNHPSVAIFCIGNEMHNSGHLPAVRALYEEGRRLAPGKLIMDNSGWGEFDRMTSDIFAQHIAYFFPYGHHAKMFEKEDPWLLNGSATDAPMDTALHGGVHGRVHRAAIPVRPVIAHEACHYIEVPDYEELNRKFDQFCARAGAEYLSENGIVKPRYLTELPQLIRRKGLLHKLPDYIAASQQFKMFALKTYWEKCRLSALCGLEMLQFADCLKYENKNGIVDCFDDDKYIPAEWMRRFNSDAVLLADMEKSLFFYGDELQGSLFISDFLPEPEITDGSLVLRLIRDDGREKELYSGKNFVVPGGLRKLIAFSFRVDAENSAHQYTLAAEFRFSGNVLRNEWNIWMYPHRTSPRVPAVCRLTVPELKRCLESKIAESGQAQTVVTDTLDDFVFADLEQGKTVFLFYHRDHRGNTYYWPGALERFKPCIWDRGSNLGGIIHSETLRKRLASGRYFDQKMQPLLEGGYKICLDDFPVPVNEIICGVDKPVRDRMKGLLHGVKNFIEEDTLRNFSHLFSVKVGTGLLAVCTLRMNEYDSPAVECFADWLLHAADELKTGCCISAEHLKDYLAARTRTGVRQEDVMNHFWEIDNKLVEDTLFWEEAQVDLSKCKE